MANPTAKVRIRMYRQGLGDCFLLSFFTGVKPVHIMLDCGTLGSAATKVKILDVVKHIAKETGGHLHLLILTHEHKDHVSGFNTGRKVFDDFMKIDKVWVAWTEDPDDPLAQEVQKYEGDLLTALLFGVHILKNNSSSIAQEKQALATAADATRELLNFDGNSLGSETLASADFAKTVHEAMTYASLLAGDLPDFRKPGEVIEPEWLPGWRFYVLGPPRDPKALNILGDHDSPELYHFNEGLAADLASSVQFHASKRYKYMAAYQDNLEDPEARQQLEAGFPFDTCFRVEGSYPEGYEPLFKSYKRDAWRRIDYDWLASFEDLALQLNNATNNTSLVLAIEFIKDKRVLLFPADAQLGNWQSWEKEEFQVTQPNGNTQKVTSRALLKNTVFYKVGHHASHNATRSRNGLEAMKHKDLVAMIPVDQEVAEKKDWHMPANGLYEELLRRTRGRVLRSDTGWPGKKPSFWTMKEWKEIKKEWKKFQKNADGMPNGQSTIEIESMYIDYWLH